jgi:hypothetical protein
MWPYSWRQECIHLQGGKNVHFQGGKNVAIFRKAKVWPFSGRQVCGHIQGGKNVTIFRMARTKI